MTRLMLASLLSLPLFAQGTLSPSNAGSPPAGGYTAGSVVQINVSKAGNASATGIQFDVQAPSGVASLTISIPAGLAASKSLTCSPGTSTTCLIVGFNTTPIPDGIIATAAITLASSVSTSPVNVTVANPLEADASGTALAVTVANPTVSLSIRNPCDVTGDGSVTSADLSAVVSAALAKAASPDLNSDGKVNVQDAQIVATAGTGPSFTCNAH